MFVAIKIVKLVKVQHIINVSCTNFNIRMFFERLNEWFELLQMLRVRAAIHIRPPHCI